MRLPSPMRSTRNERSKARAARCTAFRCLIKDNIDTADNMMTTAGSLALVGSKPRKIRPWRKSCARRRRHPGQDQSQRVGEHSLQPLHQRMERARRPDQKSLCPRPQSLADRARGTGAGISANLARWGSARRRTVQSFVLRRRMDLPASSPRSGWSAVAALSRSLTARMARGRCAGPCAMRPFCSAP